VFFTSRFSSTPLSLSAASTGFTSKPLRGSGGIVSVSLTHMRTYPSPAVDSQCVLNSGPRCCAGDPATRRSSGTYSARDPGRGSGSLWGLTEGNPVFEIPPQRGELIRLLQVLIWCPSCASRRSSSKYCRGGSHRKRIPEDRRDIRLWFQNPCWMTVFPLRVRARRSY